MEKKIVTLVTVDSIVHAVFESKEKAEEWVLFFVDALSQKGQIKIFQMELIQ